MSARRGTQFVPIGIPTTRWKTFPQNYEHSVYQKIKYLDDVIFRVPAFGVRVSFHKICFIVAQCQIFVSAFTVFENEGVPYNTSEAAF